MTTLYAPIGLPGCGKSTLIDQWIDDGKLTADSVVSTDAIREELYGSHHIQGDPEEVFGIAYERAWQRLKAGRDVYFDATNLTSKTRRQLTRTAKRSGADLVWMEFATPVDVCRERNAARLIPVPDDVMDRMVDQLVAIEWRELEGHVLTVPA